MVLEWKFIELLGLVKPSHTKSKIKKTNAVISCHAEDFDCLHIIQLQYNHVMVHMWAVACTEETNASIAGL